MILLTIIFIPMVNIWTETMFKMMLKTVQYLTQKPLRFLLVMMAQTVLFLLGGGVFLVARAIMGKCRTKASSTLLL